MVGGQRVDEMFWGKFTKKKPGGGGEVRRVDCERRIDVFVKIKRKILGGGVGFGWVQGGCERRIEVLEIFKRKKMGGGSGGGGSGWM